MNLTKTQNAGWIQPPEHPGENGFGQKGQQVQRPWDKTWDPKRPACLDRNEGGQVRDKEEGEVGEGQIMASLLWSPWQGFGMSSPNSGIPQRGFKEGANLTQVTFGEAPVYFLPLGGKSRGGPGLGWWLRRRRAEGRA